ncbi:thioesterase family protein [Nocardia stercoris]|uniref:Thioesterase family protein n=1 Tax=Nocardia stercoris TaxID=2483361 RepID=A0A3M2L0X0_9NOCA|nr:thioesterase family protein [Nocardia stercoris]RMI31034.1 thioesterase family protein [Nocardia stercoris]
MDDAPFSRVCALTALGDGRYRGEIGPIWTIGPKVHGGTMVAAGAAAATRRLRESQPDLAHMMPIAAASDFLGAPEPGTVEYQVTVRKTGRQIALVDVDMYQGERLCVHTTFTFGQLEGDEPPQYAASAADDMPAEPFAAAQGYIGSPMGKIVHVSEGADMAIDPGWARFLDRETGEPRLRIWIRPRPGDQRDEDVFAFFAIMSADMSPPVTMNLGRFGWAPTVQMTTYLRRRPTPGWLRVIATAREIGPRMFDEDQLVLDATGAVVAQSRQLALIPQPR